MKILLNICLVVIGGVLVFYVIPLARFHHVYVSPMMQVHNEIRYKPDPPGQEVFQSPEMTERLGTGDCDDYAILLQDRLKKKGHDSQILFVRLHEGGLHCVVAVNSSVLDPTWGEVFPRNEYERINNVVGRPGEDVIRRLTAENR